VAQGPTAKTEARAVHPWASSCFVMMNIDDLPMKNIDFTSMMVLPLKHHDVHRFSTGLITGGDASGHQGTISLSRVGIPAQVVDQIEEEQNTQLLRGRADKRSVACGKLT